MARSRLSLSAKLLAHFIINCRQKHTAAATILHQCKGAARDDRGANLVETRYKIAFANRIRYSPRARRAGTVESQAVLRPGNGSRFAAGVAFRT
jgi:hypothetical protein